MIFLNHIINQIIPIPKFLETLFRKKGKQISFDIFKKKENNEIINDDSTGNNYINSAYTDMTNILQAKKSSLGMLSCTMENMES